jgi:hypothetical protein
MTITMTAANWDELWEESWQTAYSPENESFVNICKTPKTIGKGIYQGIELYPDVWLGIGHRIYKMKLRSPIQKPNIRFSFVLCFLGCVSIATVGKLAPITP